MHATWGTSLITPPHQQRPSSSRHDPTIPTSTTGVVVERRTESVVTLTDQLSYTRTRRSGSTVWGPGALTGKLLKHLGERIESSAEYLVIRKKLNQITRMQPHFLDSVRELTEEDKREMTDQCEKLVDLCIVGMQYPTGLMTRAFSLILRGFKRPGRRVWTHHIAEAISKRENIDVYEIFQVCFFALLDESIFKRINGAVDLDTLEFRCPPVNQEIAMIVSYLARKDCLPDCLPASSLSLETAVAGSFSSVIIKAGFFRIVTRWVKHGLPHWDAHGKKCLEDALQDVANAQVFHGNLERHAEEAQELIQELRVRCVPEDLQDVQELSLAEVNETA
ncbi:hypothetical protein K439DRAFT_1662191 [Ramaria rubella]|nr:hypothetical protein K439DRAFT_1662191 [Ramaria rubella]